jgi:hypothetical protein
MNEQEIEHYLATTPEKEILHSVFRMTCRMYHTLGDDEKPGLVADVASLRKTRGQIITALKVAIAVIPPTALMVWWIVNHIPIFK